MARPHRPVSRSKCALNNIAAVRAVGGIFRPNSLPSAKKGVFVKLKLLSVATLLCLALMITGALAASAQQVQPLEPAWLTQMYAEGWQKIQEGVLQRETGGGEYETFTYGAEGQQWLVQSFQNQVTTFQDRYNESPSEELAALIASLKNKIDRLNAGMASAEEFNGEALEN